MKRWWLFLAVIGIGCAALGCVPRKLFWSPDGKHGAVLGAKGLYLCDEQGKVSALIAPSVELVAWSSDSKRFIAARSEEVPKWEQLARFLTKDRQEAVIAQSAPLKAEVMAYQGEWKDFSPTAGDALTPGEAMGLFVYLRDHDDGSLAKKLGDEWKNSAQFAGRVCHLQAYELTDNGAKPGPVIFSSLDSPLDLRLSPDGKTLAATYRVASGGPLAIARLVVLPVREGSKPTVVAERSAQFPDWSPDGLYLHYGTTHDLSFGIKSADGGKDQSFTLGALSRRRIVDQNGGILAPLPDPEDLVGVMFWHQMKVRCLKDGRVLFSSGEVKLPITSAEMPQHPSLFSIDLARQPTVTRMLSAEPDSRLEGLSLGEFELSPDEQRVLILGSGTKEVAVITLATGKVDTVFAADRTPNEMLSMPAWRSSQDLALLLPPGAADGLPDQAALTLITLDGKGRCVSKDWPAVFAEDAPK